MPTKAEQELIEICDRYYLVKITKQVLYRKDINEASKVLQKFAYILRTENSYMNFHSKIITIFVYDKYKFMLFLMNESSNQDIKITKKVSIDFKPIEDICTRVTLKKRDPYMYELLHKYNTYEKMFDAINRCYFYSINY
jgi:hypothetical protein